MASFEAPQSPHEAPQSKTKRRINIGARAFAYGVLVTPLFIHGYNMLNAPEAVDYSDLVADKTQQAQNGILERLEDVETFTTDVSTLMIDSRYTTHAGNNGYTLAKLDTGLNKVKLGASVDLDEEGMQAMAA